MLIMNEKELQKKVQELAAIADKVERESGITKAAFAGDNFAQDSKQLSEMVDAAMHTRLAAQVNSVKMLDGGKEAMEMQIKNMMTLLESGELNSMQAMKVSAKMSEIFAKNHAAVLGEQPETVKETLQAGFENLIVERYHLNSVSAGMTASQTGEKSYSMGGQHTFKLDDALTTTPYLAMVLSKGGGNIATGVKNSHGAYDTVVGRVIPLSGGGVGFDTATHEVSGNGYVGAAITHDNALKTTEVITGSMNNKGALNLSVTEAATVYHENKTQLDIYLDQSATKPRDGNATYAFGAGIMGKHENLQATLGGSIGNVGGDGPVDKAVNLQFTYQTGGAER